MLHYTFSVPPQIHPFDFGDESVFSGELVSAMCAVSKGDFPITISWLFNNKSIDLLSGSSVGQTNKKVSALTIDSVDESHAGLYQCVVENAAGRATYSAKLHVKGYFLKFCLLVYFICPYLPNNT